MIIAVMEYVKGIHAKLKCVLCDNCGSKNDILRMFINCEHLYCNTCFDKLYTHNSQSGSQNYCSICYEYSIAATLSIYLFDPECIREKCCDCEADDFEDNMYLCKTCHVSEFQTTEELKKVVYCSKCIIKKHMRIGHETVDFYPYLAAHQFAEKSEFIQSKSKDIEESQVLLDETIAQFKKLSTDAAEATDVLTEMTRRSKSTKYQLQFVEKIESFLNETKSIHVKTNSELKINVNKLQEALENIKKWNEEKKENCVDELETVKLEKFDETNNNA